MTFSEVGGFYQEIWSSHVLLGEWGCASVLCTIWSVAGWCFGFLCSEFLWVKEGKRISGGIGFQEGAVEASLYCPLSA